MVYIMRLGCIGHTKADVKQLIMISLPKHGRTATA